METPKQIRDRNFEPQSYTNSWRRREGTNPSRAEVVLLAQHETHVVGMPIGAGRGQRRLLNQKAMGGVVVAGSAREPLRT